MLAIEKEFNYFVNECPSLNTFVNKFNFEKDKTTKNWSL